MPFNLHLYERQCREHFLIALPILWPYFKMHRQNSLKFSMIITGSWLGGICKKMVQYVKPNYEQYRSYLSLGYCGFSLLNIFKDVWHQLWDYVSIFLLYFSIKRMFMTEMTLRTFDDCIFVWSYPQRLINLKEATRLTYADVFFRCSIPQPLLRYWITGTYWCRLAPSHYLNQCWFIVNQTPRNIFRWSFIKMPNIEIVILKYRPFIEASMCYGFGALCCLCCLGLSALSGKHRMLNLSERTWTFSFTFYVIAPHW